MNIWLMEFSMSFLVSILNLSKWIWYYNGHCNMTNGYFHKCYATMNLLMLWPIQTMSNDCYMRCHWTFRKWEWDFKLRLRSKWKDIRKHFATLTIFEPSVISTNVIETEIEFEIKMILGKFATLAVFCNTAIWQ